MDSTKAEAVWNTLGEDGRALISKHLVVFMNNMSAPWRNRAEILTDVGTMMCAAAPIELVASVCTCGCRKPFPLSRKNALDARLRCGEHAQRLLQIFVADPFLAVPDDIPEFAERAYRWILSYDKAVRRRAEIDVMAQRKVLATAQRQAVVAAQRQARRTAHEAYKASYPYRIAKAEEKVAREQLRLAEAMKVVKRQKKKITAAQRSVAALRRAVEKKAQQGTL